MADFSDEGNAWLNGKPRPKPKPRSPWKLLVDSVTEGALHSPIGAEGAMRYLGIGRPKGVSDEQLDRAERTLSDDLYRRRAQDDEAFQDADTFSPANIGRKAVEILGNIAGGVDPTYVLNPGATAARRIAAQAGINAGVDAGSQGVEIKRGVRDNYDPRQTAIAGAGGAVLQGGFEAGRAFGRRGGGLAPPAPGRVTSPFGQRRAPKVGASTMHGGIDIAMRNGTPIKASAEGVVTNIGRGHSKRGNWVEVDYGDGITSRYLHLSGFNVKVGDRVDPNRPFARSGATGNVTGPHLHWSVYKNGKPVDPRTVSLGGRGPSSRPQQEEEMAPEQIAEAPREDYLASASETLNKIVGDLPKERLAPAIMHEDGRIYVGGENTAHINIMNDYPGLENYAKDSGGFMTPDGRYLTREEAAREVGSNDVGLEAVSYNRGTSVTDMYAGDKNLDAIDYALKNQEAHPLNAEIDAINKRMDETTDMAEFERLQLERDEVMRSIEQDVYGTLDGVPIKPNEGLAGKVAKGLKAVLKDKQGSVPRGPTNAELLAQAKKLGIDTSNIKDLAELRKLIEYHSSLRGKMAESMKASQEAAQKAKDEGKFKYEVGDRILTPKGEELGQEPWRITGYYVDPKNPDRYGYRVERGKKGKDEDDPESTYESSQLIINDPKMDAKFKEMGRDFDRAADVAAWKKVADTSAEVKQFPLRDGTMPPLKETDPDADLANGNPFAMSREEFLAGPPKKEVLTPAEKQEMDASAEKPANGNTGADKFISKVVQTVKDIFNDNEGAFRPFHKKDGSLNRVGKLVAKKPSAGRVEQEPAGADLPDGPVKKLVDALQGLKPLAKDQKKLYKEERAKRLAGVAKMQAMNKGEAGFHSELAQLKGSMAKVDFENIRDQFNQDEIDELFDMVRVSNRMTLFDKLTTRTALSKLLGADGASVPTAREIELLGEVFPKELVDGLLKNKTFRQKLGEHITNALNLPRAMMATLDLSAPFRQGIVFVGRKEFWGAFAGMFKQYGSERAYKAVQDEIASRPTYKLMLQSRLALSKLDGSLAQREEDFMTNWAEKIPVFGIAARASNRAYSGFLNKLRADTFDTLVRQGREAGIDFKHNAKALKDIANFVNAATGRGGLGKLTQAAPALNAVFFSPRLIASRLQMLNPAFYVKMDPFVRKQALKSVMGFGGIALTVLGLAKMGGAEVEHDPRATDFGKIKVGKTRYDVLGGFQQYVRLGAQLISGTAVNSNSGKESDLTETKFASTTRKDKVEQFGRSKLSPVASFIVDLLDNKSVIGEPVEFPKAIVERFIPLIAQDTYESVKEYGSKGLLNAIPAMFGVGTMTYTPKQPKPRKNAKSEADSWLAGEDTKTPDGLSDEGSKWLSGEE